MKRIMLLVAIMLLSFIEVTNAEEHEFTATPVREEYTRGETNVHAGNRETVLATSDILVLDDANGILKSRINAPDAVGVITLNIISRENTYIKIRYSDSNITSRNSRDEYFAKAGAPFVLQFAAFEPTSGIIEVLNLNDEVVLEVPYQVLGRKTKRHSISSSVSHSIRATSEDKTTVNIGYRMSTIKTDSTDGSHSIGFSVGTDLDFDSVRVNVNYNYNF